MIKVQYPYIDDNGNERPELIKHYTDDETKILLQVETGYLYDEAIDIYEEPLKYTYEEIDRPVEEEETEETENDKQD